MTKKRAKGQPTKYKPEYCDALIAHFKEGGSIEGFSAVIGVCQDTIFEWFKVHKDFSDAKKVGLSHARLLYDKIAMSGMLGKVKGFNATVWVFTMKNRFGWRDKVEMFDGEENDEMEFVEG